MCTYNTIAENPNSTVVAEYIPDKKVATHYQSENELELEFIRLLEINGYEYLNITKNDDLLKNLRARLSKLNDIEFSENEWQQILSNYLANKNEGLEEKTAKVQEDYIFNLKRDDGSTKNVRILDKDNIHNNSVQVINQYEAVGARETRYDVTVLVNGLPMVHVELKKRGVAIREAFNQINRYKRDSFWADSGLFDYVQLFVISNGTHTKYYSNTTHNAHLKEQKGRKSGKKTGNSFEFTCWWTDARNKRISDLVDFGKTFFSKHSLLSILTKYCVFTSDKLLLVMRPYQIAATERIMNRIAMSTNHKQLGTIDAGGYIWHTTGSGKTLTSFKAAQLATRLDGIDKVLFVVDRKDLDYQTMKEYDKFQKGSANSNISTAVLTKQLANPNAKIIITTIQKLANFISAHKGHSVFDGHIVLIFDECHRSQFGEMHRAITKAFKKYHIFGFTGTPIFTANSPSGGNPHLKTTEQAFGKKLHSYTIVDAINDGNVLPFRVEYTNTLKMKEGVKDKKVQAIDMEAAANSPKRISQVTNYILEHFEQKTKRNVGSYSFSKLSNIAEVVSSEDKSSTEKIKEIRNQVRLKGFNSIFAVSSIEVAKKYYTEFKSRDSGLKIATIFSFGANEEDDEDGILPDEDFDTGNLDQSSRDFLDMAIGDYNKHFGTSYNTGADKFENYYKDLSQRMKNREIDLLIVVNMFLTGFDATTLNTLWVDKSLRHHGLLQAFSRTNRILNSVKTFGNIICFRDLEQATNDALSIFGNKEAGGVVLLKSFDEYYNGWEKDGKPQKGYVDLITELQDFFPLPVFIEGEQAEKDFIKLWGAILRLRNILTSFDEFSGNEILSERDFQDYQSAYLDLYDKHRRYNESNKENINDDIEFEIELVKQVTVNIDYILQLVAQYHKSRMDDQDIMTTIGRAMDSSLELRSKKELIERFINTLNVHSDVDNDWHSFTDKNRAEELDKIIKEENLKPEKTKKFIANAFRDGELKPTGTGFASILPPVSMFDKDNMRSKKKMIVLEKLKLFFEKYRGV
ncbi:MAG: type I restriction endonuclease subunit R [Alphaproteobacteria bacterium]|nr:type I restriction endonuclease subunit R [Alphaproteobacteria bacterium]NCQ66393.1 type I restriction endonuclease subunit R [Alphaproteobacteria bacterium]NCT06878.1 type I restriction endonuclease subunit R [Alphaproteobacteria bacterium]